MGTSTNGQICYGVVFEDEYEFPWDALEQDFEDWWRVESGWKWTGEEPYTPEGEYAEGFGPNDPRTEAWWDSRSAWSKAHPPPAVLLNYQSDRAPAFMLAVPSSVKVALRGYPERFTPVDLTVTEEERQTLAAFLRRYDLTPETEPGWFLTSYWG